MADVLVVEATPLVQIMISNTMRDVGLGVSATDSADAALEAAATSLQPPKVLVTAIRFGQGGLNGIGLAAALRCRWPDLAVVYLADQPTDLTGDTLGAQERCLMKPFDLARLAQLVCELAPPCPKPPRLIRGRAVMR